MKSQDLAVLTRAALYSFLAGATSGSIYLVIAQFYGMSMNGSTLTGSLLTAAIAFVVAFICFAGFMLYFSRKYSS